MNLDEEILCECKSLITAFKKHLSLINAEYLSQHIIGVIRHGVVHYRDPDNNWYYKNFCADLDFETKSIIGTDKQTGHYLVMSSCFRDYYLNDLIDSLKIETEEHYHEEDEDKLKEFERKWKDEVLTKYQLNEHLRRFVWDLKPFKYSHKYGHLREHVLELINKEIPNNVDFYSFVYCGLCYKCLDYNHPYGIHVAIKNAVGLFGNYVHYGRDKFILPDQKIIEIPPTTYAPGLRHCTIVEISKGVFEALHEIEIIKLPQTVKKLDWSFWHCRRLKSIEVHKENKYFCSLDGVLYSHDKRILYAYPNAHGNIYEVPEGVEIIEKFAFKDCDNIEILMLPSTIKHIKVNAFYRAKKLAKVICACKKDDFVDEGLYGDHGNVAPQWFYMQ